MSSNPNNRTSAPNREETERIETLFKKLDSDGDGTIDIKDLTQAFKKYKLPSSTKDAEDFFKKYDKNQDGVICMSEFVNYIREHETAMKVSFDTLDHNKDGYIDVNELIHNLNKIGVHVSRPDALNMIQRMDKDNSLTINWTEWRDFLFLYPSTELSNICNHWRHSLVMDTGEPAVLPDDLTEDELRSGGWWKHLVAGGIAGAISRSCTAPFDRIKLTLMVYASQKNPMGIVSCIKYMVNEGGVRSLWRGNGVNVFKIVPETAVKFMAYEQIKKMMMREGEDLGVVKRFVAGSTAGVISQTVIYPMEVLKTRLSLRKSGQYEGVLDCAKKIYSQDGYRIFFKGYLTNLIGIIPYAGIDLTIYETLKGWYIGRYSDDRQPGSLVLLACGSLSSCSGALASYPLALIRARQQMNISVHEQELSLIGHFRHILQHEGFRGLYRGLAPNFLKVAPAVSISYVIYEKARNMLGVKMS